MTKEIDFLSITKSETSTTVNKTDNNSSKKEGLSLFDSLLLNTKESSKTVPEDSLKDNSSNVETLKTPQKQEKITQESNLDSNKNINNSKTNTNINTNEVETIKTSNEDTVKKETPTLENVKQNIKTNDLEIDNKVETKSNKTIDLEKNDSNINTKLQSSTSTLLDKIVLEANKNIKNLNTQNSETNIKNEVKTVDSSLLEEGELKIQNSSTSEKSEIISADKKINTNTLDTEESDIKTTIKNQEVNNLIDNESQVDTKVVNNTKDANIIINKESVKIDTLEVNDIKTIDLDSENKTTNDPKNFKSDTLEVKSEFVKPTLNDEEVIDDIEVKSTKVSSIDNTIEKLTSSKEQIQTTISFDNNIDSETSELKTPISNLPKVESKIEASESVIEDEDSSISKLTKVENDNSNTKLNKNESVEELISSKITEINSSEDEVSLDNQKRQITAETLESVSKPSVKTSENEIDIDNTKDTSLKQTVPESVSSTLKTTVTNDDLNTVPKTNIQSQSQAQTQQQNSNLSSLDDEAFVDEEQRVNISKESLKESSEQVSKNENQENKNGRSLMDRLFDNANKQTISAKTSDLNNQTLDSQVTNQKSNDLATNIFLSSQKNSIYTQMVVNKSEGVKTLKDASSIEDVKKGASILDLGLEDTSVEIEKPIKQNSSAQQMKGLDSKISILDKLAFDKNMNLDELINKATQTTSTSTVSSTSTTSEEVTVNVNSTLALSIQNRIIGAQQQMSSMMSDVARNMYENYKPPVTAFRLNLFPSQLGHIAILMKNDRENSISITMNMSQSSTLDAFVENQSVLRDALNRNFTNNNQTNFNLEFNMEEESSNSSSFSENQQNSEQDSQSNQTNSSDEIIESIVQNQDETEDINYL